MVENRVRGVRLPDDLWKAIPEKGRGAFIRRALWAAVEGGQAPSGATLDEVAALRRELSAVGRNLNQIARALNVDPKAGAGVSLAGAIEDVRRLVAQIDGEVAKWGARYGD